MRFLYIAATAVLLSPVCATLAEDGLLFDPRPDRCLDRRTFGKDGNKDDCESGDNKFDKFDRFGHKCACSTKAYVSGPKSIWSKPGPMPTTVAPLPVSTVTPPLPPPPAPPAVPISQPTVPLPSMVLPSTTSLPQPSTPSIVLPPTASLPQPSTPSIVLSPTTSLPQPSTPSIVLSPTTALPRSSTGIISSSVVPVIVVPTSKPVPSITSRPTPPNTAPFQNTTRPPPATFTGNAILSNSQCLSLLIIVGTVWLGTVML